MAVLKVTIFDQVWKANFTNAQEVLMKNALKTRYGYQANIPNPAFNPVLPVSPENSPIIANPLTPEDYIAKAILAELVGSGKTSRLHEVQRTKQQEADSQVTSEFANITIDEVVA
jgi:predicted Zn-dependent peptidase